ncbi:hypothetical protein COCON_G00202220 [Conger conger]|uniref:Histone-lysine N-methyltransferase SETD1A n=1 Tax=Conger conger TaxID=82655 RepID=A0A9Q1HMZ5_CONCO|nr:hypothetical protein COCON_G00202220 [Conger conger]
MPPGETGEALSESMDPDSGADSQRALSLQWKSYKLIQDPAIRRVAQKVYRYDGVHFSVPDSGFAPVGDLRDPRPRRIWSKRTELALPVPKFKLDEFYVGPIPLKEVTFARLNDNIREPFLAEMCAKFGEVEEMEILFHPKTRKHLGLARVLFTSTRGAKDTVKHLHNTSVMGNIVHAQLDIKGQQRMKYYDLIVSGSYTPQTVPTGGKALTDRFQPPVPTHPDTSSDVRRRLSADVVPASLGVPPPTPGSTTPCSSDTGFSEQRLDTPPSSLGGPYTPGSSASSQGGTPYTPRSGTPFSQDSGFSSRHGSVGFGGNSYPPPDLLPSSSCSSSAVSSSSSIGGYKTSRYHDDPHALPQEHLPYHRGRPSYPLSPPTAPTSRRLTPPSPTPEGAARTCSFTLHFPPRLPAHSTTRPPTQSGSAYHSHHHHSERREERGHRSGSASRSGDHAHQRHRNHHHSHNHHSAGGRRRASHDRDRDRDRDRARETEHPNSHPNSGSGHPSSSSNSLSPPPSTHPYPSSKEQPALPPHEPAPPSRLEPPAVFRPPAGAASDKDYRLLPHHTSLPPPPPAPCLRHRRRCGRVRSSSSPEPDSTNESLPFVYHSSSLDSRIEMLLKEQKAKFSFLASDDEEDERKGEEEAGPCAGAGAGRAAARGAGAPAAGPEGRKWKQKEGDADGDRNRRREGLAQQDGGRPRRKGERERERDARRRRGRKEGAESKRSPAQAAATPSSASSAQSPPPDSAPTLPSHIESTHSGPTDPRRRPAANTPPTYNGQGQQSPRSSGEDMEISDEDDGNAMATGGTTAPPSSSPAAPSQVAPPPQPSDPTSSPAPPPPLADFGVVLPPFPAHLPPPAPGFPPPHMELHPEYPPPLPPPMFDYASSMELIGQYCGGAPMSFQMQTQMLSRLHQLRLASSPTPAPEAPPNEYPPSYPLAPSPRPPTWTKRFTEGQAQHPHEATVQMALATLIQEMKSIMQRDLNRKMVENIAFGTFDEWWERKERKAKPFQTAVRGPAALREEEKKEEKPSGRPREPLLSLVDWAKSGGLEGFSLRGALRLPSFKVKRKEITDGGELKRPRPSTLPDEEEEDLYPEKGSGAAGGLEGPGAEMAGRRRRRAKRMKRQKSLGLDSGGEETSDGSSSDKEDDDDEDSDKEDDSEDEVVSGDSEDESSSSSSSESSSSSSSSSPSSSEDEEDEEEEGERAGESEGLDTMDESTMDSTLQDREKDERERERLSQSGAAAASKVVGLGPSQSAVVQSVKTEAEAEAKETAAPPDCPPPDCPPPVPRPSSPILLLPPLKKRRKTVSFSTEEVETPPPPARSPPSSYPAHALLLSPVRAQLPESILTPSALAKPLPVLLPFASKPGEAASLSPSCPPRALTFPPAVRSLRPDEPPPKSPGPPASPAKSPAPASPSPPAACRTVHNLPLDHASMVRLAYDEPAPAQRGPPRGRPRTAGLSAAPATAPSEREEEEELGGASSLLQLASVALKLEPETQDSEETETSDEAEEMQQEMEREQAEPLGLQGLQVLQEHNYSRLPFVPVLPGHRKARADPLPAHIDLHAASGILEAPEEVVGEPLAKGEPAELCPPLEALSGVPALAETGAAEAQAPTATTPLRKRGAGPVEVEAEQEAMGKVKGRKKKRREKEQQQMKKQKERQSRKRRKKQLEELDPDEEVDVEQLEPGELSNSEEEEEQLQERREDLRKSERLFLQPARAKAAPLSPRHLPLPYEQRSEFEQMTILYDIWNVGLDTEDMRLLKMTYEKLLQDDHSTDWLNDTHWSALTNIPNPRRKKKNQDEQLREHQTGCARSEGYYAISRKEKDIYLDLDPVTSLEPDYDNTGTNRILSERRSEQRRLLSAIGTTAVLDSDLLKLNQLKFRKKKLRFGRSRIHEWGLFAMEPIAADEMVIEYVGQNIRQMVADNREKRYAQEGIGSSYLFRVDHDTIIDATKCGNLARFINHCCTPNCYAKVITIESQKKIVIYSKQPIGVNEEITYDYKFPIEENKIPCLCGTENCRGTLN